MFSRDIFSRDFGKGVLWAVITILLAMAFSYLLGGDGCFNPGITLGTLIMGLYLSFRRP